MADQTTTTTTASMGLPAVPAWLDRHAPGLAHQARADLARLERLAPEVAEILGRIHGYGARLDTAVIAEHGENHPAQAWEAGEHAIGLDGLWRLADLIRDVHPELNPPTRQATGGDPR